jgi:hypothetical protein
MAEHDSVEGPIFEIIKKQLDIMQLIAAGRADDLNAPEDLTDAQNQLTTIFSIKSQFVSISNDNRNQSGWTKVVGDYFDRIDSGTIIVNRGALVDSLDRLALSSGENVIEPWARIAMLVNESGSSEAADNFNAMSQELALEKPRKSVLKSLWGGIVAALPAITQLVSLGEQISQIFK